MISWTALDPAENPVLSLDMSDAIAKQGGSALASATVTVTVANGADPSPGLILPGACSVANGIVSVQKAANTGVSGTSYVATFKGLTAAGKTIVGQVSFAIQTGGA